MASSGARRLLVVMLTIVAVLLVLRAAAPEVVERYLNQQLANLGDYRGHVDDVDLALWRGSYTINGFTVEKSESEIEQPLLVLPRMEASVQWRALLHGELVADATLIGPVIHFVQQAEDSQYGEGTNWQERFEALFPVRVSHIEVNDGRLHFLNPAAQPPVDVFLSDAHIVVANLTNIRETSSPVFTELMASATAMGRAPLEIKARLDPLQDQPQFDLNIDLRDLELTQLNPLLMEYANVTAEAGTFSLSGEVAAADGAYEGYVKPLLDHAEFLEPKDFKERPLGALWETVVAAVSELLENQPRNRLGTRVPISGQFGPQPEVWPAIGGVFRNMFDALLQGIEGSVDLEDAVESAKEDDSDT